MIKLSVFIITKNEEDRIRCAIDSVKEIADEVVVVDSGSTDQTVAIAKSLGANVIVRDWPGYVKQKAFAEGLCKNDWVLNIDADESLTPELQNEIKTTLKNIHEKQFAFNIKMLILHRHDDGPRWLAPINKSIRLYKRTVCSFANTVKLEIYTTHDRVSFNHSDGQKHQVSDFKHVAYHRSNTSMGQLIQKADFYSTEQAKDLIRSGRKIRSIRLVNEFLFVFIKAFFIRRYFVFGLDGFIDSMGFAFARFSRLAKAREILLEERLSSK